MTKAKAKVEVVEETRGTMTEENIEFMMNNWDEHDMDFFVKEFGVKESTVACHAALVRKRSDGEVCQLKRRKKEDIIDELLEKRKAANKEAKEAEAKLVKEAKAIQDKIAKEAKEAAK